MKGYRINYCTETFAEVVEVECVMVAKAWLDEQYRGLALGMPLYETAEEAQAVIEEERKKQIRRLRVLLGELEAQL